MYRFKNREPVDGQRFYAHLFGFAYLLLIYVFKAWNNININLFKMYFVFPITFLLHLELHFGKV